MRGGLSLRLRLAVVVLAAVTPLAAVTLWLAHDLRGDAGSGPFAAVVLALAIGLLCAWWYAGRAVIKPAKQILAAVRKVEQGRLDARVPLVSAQEARWEFARIAAAFNLIADSLQQRKQDIDAELWRSRNAYHVLDTVLNSMQEGLIAVDLDGEVLMFNSAASRLFALDGVVVPLHDWPAHFGLFEPATRARFDAQRQSLARALRGETGEHLVLVSNDLVQGERLLRCAYRPIRTGTEVTGGLAVFGDVTDLDRAESDLVLLRNAIARVNDIVLITSANPIDLPGPRIVFVNEAFERLTGYSAREALGNTPRMLQGPGTDAAALGRIRAALEQGQPVREEILNYTKDSRQLWLELDIVPLADESGAYSHLIGVMRDITARKHHESELRDLNAGLELRIAERTAELARQMSLYRTLAQQAPEVVWNTDATGTRLTFLNRAWYDLVGGSEEDWLDKSGLSAIHPDDREEVSANWRRSRETLATFAGIRRLRDRNGIYHTMSYRGAPVFDEGGDVAFWVGIDSDITGQKAIEEALRATNQELEAFSYSVSHDLRAPLAAIDGFSKALAGRMGSQADDQKAVHYLSRIQAGVLRMEQLIEGLLALSRVARGPLHHGPVDLSAIARETVESLQAQHPDRVIEAVVQDDLVAEGDARLLRIVIENLLGNAWKFTSRKEAALVEVGRLPDAPVFFVRDNGVGFDMDYADKLFSAFQRLHTESEFPGTGIGLATVRRIVSRHQGKVWAESVPAEGTCFYFTLSPPSGS